MSDCRQTTTSMARLAMTDRKKPGVAFWAAAASVIVLAYPLSFGPACWLVSRVAETPSDFSIRAHTVIYHPLRLAGKKSETIARVIVWYGHLCVPNSGDP